VLRLKAQMCLADRGRELGVLDIGTPTISLKSLEVLVAHSLLMERRQGCTFGHDGMIFKLIQLLQVLN